MYSNCCSSCSFERDIIKIGESSHKMYSKNILNFQESTPILNANIKKSGNLLKAPRILRCDREERINQISECRKLAQKEYKTRHD